MLKVKNFNNLKNQQGDINHSLIHVVIIPDGNRRWAEESGIKPQEGYKKGIGTLEQILNKWTSTKIPYFTFWGSSLDNIRKRTQKEVKFLFRLVAQQFKKIAQDKRIHDYRVKINVLGRWREILPEKTKKIIQKTIDKTKDYNKYFLTFLLAYDGQDEMINCVTKILEGAKDKALGVTRKIIKGNLWTKDLPPVDLVIRTGCRGDPHVSAGFMMWDTSYSQYHFTETFFPAFSPEEFGNIITDYLKRERRIGR